MKLAVHDLLMLNTGETPKENVQKTRGLVQYAESLGYSRYWFSEHHGFPASASIAPELLVAYYAAATKTMRLGTGGTMIMHYSPLKIAETFKTLEAIAPGRIDLGLGRAPGGGPAEIMALSEGRPMLDRDPQMYGKINDILALLTDGQAADASPLYRNVFAAPDTDEDIPQPWMLGSSGQSAMKAAELGLGYSFVKWFGYNPGISPAVFRAYRDSFKPSVFFDHPIVSMDYRVLICETEEELHRHEKSFELSYLTLGQPQATLVSPDRAESYVYTEADEARLKHAYDNRILIKGTKQQVKDILDEEIAAFHIDELMVHVPVYSLEARKNTYKYLADMYL
ncbi:MsnO8 family LLM class oxidoreductase [Bifidobacterium sp. ESL0800]|uniref:MsnO8 family LLM class oxidoreductase n=1 Tax=Bifidobacterium sp. ESL0800 TaxID=2983236 RepID=UPI0023F66E29|nr:MsnO8 family LLM class oxidoreductase [Bifidobacterium sp. ESL0800]WEV76010.1 MsnO8 family LLM class oxidoreductase [Bifidobacterium sp. ESL0800]